VKLYVKRYKQKTAECAVAAVASVANFYNSKMGYRRTRKIALDYVLDSLSGGLDSGEIISLLNFVGFEKVTTVSCDINFLDFSWANLSREELVEKLDCAGKISGRDYRSDCKSLCKALSDFNYANNLIIDYKFDHYIKPFLLKNQPLILCFNWTIFFKQPKYSGDLIDPFYGEWEEHAVVACGYNRRGVHVVDSHVDFYKGVLGRYKNGRYYIPWVDLRGVMGFGDIYMPENYNAV